MLITEEEALRRLNSTDNLLHRIKRGNTSSVSTIEIEKSPELSPFEELEKRDSDKRALELSRRREEKETDERGGRYLGQTNIPPIFRELIGTAARIGGPTQSARAWGTSVMHAHHLSHGRTGPDKIGDRKKDLIEAIEFNTQTVRNKVLGRIEQAVTGITDEKLENKDAKELSMIARNLSSILSSTRVADGPRETNAQIIVFSPEQAKEAEYDIIEVN